jgi:hypothetical protein
MSKVWRLSALPGLLLALIWFAMPAGAADTTWVDIDAQGGRRVHLYFFWSKLCPHCQTARPAIEALPARHPWLVLHSHEITTDRVAAERYVAMAAALDQEASSVPAFLFCGRMEVGFDRTETTGRALEEALRQCHDTGVAVWRATAGPATLELPWLGPVASEQLSLPMFTLVIAGLDAFNPCAFFVLLFLLSLLVHAGGRWRMLFIGSVFVCCSGLLYFLFMAAWLNVFHWLGEISLITTLAGVLAVAVALIHIKDYFWFRKGLSLSLPDSAKPGLYQRVRGLLRADSLAALTLGTITLAVAANTYELLCTAGFPMLYTRLLTLASLSPGTHYAYLALYNLIYVIPLLVITLAFTFTLGSRKMSEAEGRLLKLVSGLMMLGLGTLLVVAPDALNNLWTALMLLAGTLGLSWIIHQTRRGRGGRDHGAHPDGE